MNLNSGNAVLAGNASAEPNSGQQSPTGNSGAVISPTAALGQSAYQIGPAPVPRDRNDDDQGETRD